MWQLDLTEFETSREGRWQTAGCTDYVAKYEFERWVSPTQMRHDAIDAVKPRCDVRVGRCTQGLVPDDAPAPTPG